VTEQPPTPEDVPARSSQGEADASEPAPLTEESPTVVQPAAETPPLPAAEPPAAVEPTPPPPPAEVEPPPAAGGPPPPPPVAPPPSFATDSGPAAAPRDRPEIPIAGAFVAGLVLALILKRLAR
jgi:periplasmic protein TonB